MHGKSLKYMIPQIDDCSRDVTYMLITRHPAVLGQCTVLLVSIEIKALKKCIQALGF